MKQLLFTGILLLGGLTASFAQVDDIYATGADQSSQQRNRNQAFQQDEDYDNASSQVQSYNSPDDYIDDDNVSYSARINRFYYPFYNRPYYSRFYNPFWYDPFWVDPFYGYYPYRMRTAFSFGMGPYWYGNWGWNTWFGYPTWGSCWYHPAYNYGCGYAGGGYWNNFYNNVDYRRNNNVVYGNRSQLGGYRTLTTRGNGLRVMPGNQQNWRNNVYGGQATQANGNYRNGTAPSQFQNQRNPEPAVRNDGRGWGRAFRSFQNGSSGPRMEAGENNAPSRNAGNGGSRGFWGNTRSYDAGVSRPSNNYSAPSRGYNSNGGHSGGGNYGGGGGGSVGRGAGSGGATHQSFGGRR